VGSLLLPPLSAVGTSNHSDNCVVVYHRLRMRGDLVEMSRFFIAKARQLLYAGLKFVSPPQNAGFVAEFDEGPTNVGILLRGQSLLRVKDYWDRFEEGYFANDFRQEWKLLSPEITTKRWAHVVNRVPASWFTKKEYEIMGIQRVLTNHFPSRGVHPFHKVGVPWEYMPEEMRDEIPGDLKDGRGYPSIGIQTVAYIASVVRPKNIWLFGLDFYHSHYLVSDKIRKEHHLAKQKRMVSLFFNLVRQFEDITFHMATNYPHIPEIPNLVLI